MLRRISKKRDRFLRLLLTHGTCAVLRAARVAQQAHRSLDGPRSWALAVQGRMSPQRGGVCPGQQVGAHLLRGARGCHAYGQPGPCELNKRSGLSAFAIAA